MCTYDVSDVRQFWNNYGTHYCDALEQSLLIQKFCMHCVALTIINTMVIIQCNGIRWAVDSIVSGFDTFFKMLFALNLCFPSETQHFFVLFQRIVYNVKLSILIINCEMPLLRIFCVTLMIIHFNFLYLS